MLVPISWLREFTPYEGAPEMLGERLTMLGLELEGVVNPFADLKDIIVGQVVECVPHPDSDHMHCCRVDLGQEALVDIVCGAPNVAAGQKVAVAPVGAVLPGGLEIKKAKLRGQPSNGMICSERELGLGEDHSGIMVLPKSVDVGSSFIAALSLDTEVLDLSVTPNRSDCLSILGVAREVSAAYGLPFNVPDSPLIIDDSAPEIIVPVQIDDPDLCYLYAGRVITGAKVSQSPMRMRYRLHAVGVRPISNLVDVTNYILMECGQPLHAFDLDKLQQQRIIVRRAHRGERLTTLDGKERILCEDDLCICDPEKAVALAGVMGGANSEITAQTQNIFLESAVFNPRSIRRTSRRLNLQSEASYRFERGIDQRRSIWSLDRAAAMMASLCGGYARQGFTVAEPRPFAPVRIAFAPQAASRLLGVEIAADFQEQTLSSLGCAVDKRDQDNWIVVQPSWRPDLTREADIIEEVGRLYGLDKIEPVIPAPQRRLDENLAPHGRHDFWRLVKFWGAGLGLHEVINYSFVGEKDLNLLGMPQEKRLKICNPLSEDQNVLRTCLAPGLLRDLANNLAYGATGCRLFELASIFEADTQSETGAKETGMLGVLLYGARHANPWPKRDEDFQYADIKGVLENLRAFLHLAEPICQTVQDHPWLLPCARIKINDWQCGYMGRVKPQIAKDYNAQKPVWILEVDLEMLRAMCGEATTQFKALPVYPAIRRDITVMAKKELRVDEVLEKIALMRLPILEGAILADCYEKPEQNERNLTFRLTFRDPARTLKDAEADKERDRIAEYLRKELGVRI